MLLRELKEKIDMGMYTQFHFASELKKDTPEQVINVLNFMAGSDVDELSVLPEHDFFKCERWQVLFRMDSYNFDYETHCNFKQDEHCGDWYLSVTSNLKNYSNEIDKFVDWIEPYLNKATGDFLGYSRYEETEIPELIYKH